jgi:hypothetical protein
LKHCKPMNKPNASVSMEFRIDDIRNQTVEQLKHTIRAVTHIYHGVMNYEEDSVPPLQTDSLAITIGDPGDVIDKAEMRDETFNWLFKKAFEEFITGLTASLVRLTNLYITMLFLKGPKTKITLSPKTKLN